MLYSVVDFLASASNTFIFTNQDLLYYGFLNANQCLCSIPGSEVTGVKLNCMCDIENRAF